VLPSVIFLYLELVYLYLQCFDVGQLPGVAPKNPLW